MYATIVKGSLSERVYQRFSTANKATHAMHQHTCYEAMSSRPCNPHHMNAGCRELKSCNCTPNDLATDIYILCNTM